jgi:O-antigen biosynthesis protein
VIIFYKAMQIFANKHYSNKMAGVYSLIINIAIYFRAFLSILKRSVIKTIPFCTDAVLAYSGFFILAKSWEHFWFQKPNYYPIEFFTYIIPLIIVVQLISNWISGGYKTPFVWKNAIKGIFYGAAFVLIIYALLPAEYRYSRTLIISGTFWTLFSVFISRFILSLTNQKDYQFYITRKNRIAIVGFIEETRRIESLLKQSELNIESLIYVYPENKSFTEEFSGTLSQIGEIIDIHKINEIIFSASDISSQTIINQMKTLSTRNIDFKIASPDSYFVIGSNSSNTSGDFYSIKAK